MPKASGQVPARGSAHSRLGRLVGTWDVEAIFPNSPKPMTGARAQFRWLKEGPFLLYTTSAPQPSPNGACVIGLDESTRAFSMLYSDSRNVSRLYEMRLTNAQWTLHRSAPRFHQRFKARIARDARTITGVWEKSSDGKAWEHDFQLVYRRRSR